MKSITTVFVLCLVISLTKAQELEQSKSMKYHSLIINNQKTMNTTTEKTELIIKQFNDAFKKHDPTSLKDIISPFCIMETMQAPDGVRYEGYDACFDFWKMMASDTTSNFDIEEVFAAGNRATIRWRYSWGTGKNNAVRGVTLLKMQDGKIIEALGYGKTPAPTGLDNYEAESQAGD